jgi:hypothetical protein
MRHTHEGFASSNPLRQVLTVAALAFAVGVPWLASPVMGRLWLLARQLGCLQ